LRDEPITDGAAANGLVVTVRVQAREARVALSGELDLATTGQLEAELRGVLQRRPSRLVIDLFALEFMDASGLRVLLRARQRAQQAGGRLELVRARRQPHRLLELCGELGLLADADSGAPGGG
jgi:anti-sigma B factor antagonist